MNAPEPTIVVNVDVRNPGQFFACCGLLELAERLWGEAEGWFEGQPETFRIATEGDLPQLIEILSAAELKQLDPDDNTASPLLLSGPFRDLHLDWWRDERSGGKELKVWAGTMESARIARAMQHALRDPSFRDAGLFDVGTVAYDPDNGDKKVEPFYFDSRRGPNAHSRDVGFSANDLQLTTTAFPAVELLCLVGLQRCLPAGTSQARVFDYHTWGRPISALIAPVAARGFLPQLGGRGYRFENWYRTGQRKHKAFRPAVLLPNPR